MSSSRRASRWSPVLVAAVSAHGAAGDLAEVTQRGVLRLDVSGTDESFPLKARPE